MCCWFLAGSRLCLSSAEAGGKQRTKSHLMSAVPAGEESKGLVWLQHCCCQDSGTISPSQDLLGISSLFSPDLPPSSPKGGSSKAQENKWTSVVRTMQPDKTKRKGRSVLLWGYLPEDAGWLGFDFLYVTMCFFKRRWVLP